VSRQAVAETPPAHPAWPTFVATTVDALRWLYETTGRSALLARSSPGPGCGAYHQGTERGRACWRSWRACCSTSTTRATGPQALRKPGSCCWLGRWPTNLT
jgi:hypothetical protein